MSSLRIASLFCILIMTGCQEKISSPKVKSEVPSVPKVVIEKEKPEKYHAPPPEVKVKLKRDNKENYSWELNGSDVDEILKANEKLRKKLGGESGK